MKPKVVSVPLSQIRTDGGTQSRAALDEDTIAEYAAAYAAGAEMPPVTLFFESETMSHWLADGFHRCAGAQRAGVKRVMAEIRPGTLRDAILHSVGANARHGLRRTNADKRSAVEKLLGDSEWGARTDAWIAEKTGTSDRFVADLRASHPERFGVEERIGRDGRTYKVPKAEAGGGAVAIGSGADDRREGKSTSTAGGGVVPPVALPGDSSASPANVGTEDEPFEPGEPAPPPPDPIDMRGLTASPWWFQEVDAVQLEVNLIIGALNSVRPSLDRMLKLGHHKTHTDAIMVAVGHALFEVDRRTPAAACLACRDPEGKLGKRETCGVCLGCGYVVRSQVDPLVKGVPKKLPSAAPAAKPTPAPPPERCVPAKSPTRNIRMVRDGVDVPYDDIPPPGDDDALEPVS